MHSYQSNHSPKRIGIIIGSLRKESLNKKLADCLIQLAPSDLLFHIIDISRLPLYNEDLEKPSFPESVLIMREEILKSDLILFITPEYNRSFPGVLKNAVDWASRPVPPNKTSVLYGKQAAIAGVSPGKIGTAVAQSHLRSILQILGMQLIFQPEIYLNWASPLFDEYHLPANESLKSLFYEFLEALK